MARTVVKEQQWSGSGNAYQSRDGITFESSVSRLSRYRKNTQASEVVQHSSLVSEIDHFSALKCSTHSPMTRQVAYNSPSAKRGIGNEGNYEVEHSGNMENDTYSEYDSTEHDSFQNTSGYLLMWRKCLYFILSKPTHIDVEVLSRINTIGKKKIVLMVLLPLLLYLLLSAFMSKRQESFNIPSSNSDDYSLFSSSISDSEYSTGSDVNDENEYTSSATSSGNDSSLSSVLWSSILMSLSSLFSTKKSYLPSENNYSKSSLNITEIETLVRRIISEDPDSLRYFKINQQNNHEIIEKITKLHKEFINLQLEFKILKETVNKKSDEELSFLKESKENIQTHKEHFEVFDNKIHQTQQKILVLEESLSNMKNCCVNESELILLMRDKLTMLMHGLMSDTNGSDFPNFKEWLYSNFATKEMVENLMKSSMVDAKEREKTSELVITEALKKHIETLSLKSSSYSTLSDVDNTLTYKNITEIEILIRKAILLYDADKTGQTDYALESGGGSIVNTRCSETYSEHSARISILGFPLWHLQNSPRNAIQPSVHPGECWAFKGSQGYLVIQLAAVIKPTGFVVEHIPKSISSNGNIDSAPKDFSVHGLMSEKDFEGELLGKYSYDKDGEPLQYFSVQAENVIPYRFIELKIHSNQGNGNYTCLYRFRVHGFRQ